MARSAPSSARSTALRRRGGSCMGSEPFAGTSLARYPWRGNYGSDLPLLGNCKHGSMVMPGDVDHAWDLMEEIQICMLVTRDARNLRSRPMGAYVRRHEHAVYFLTDIRHHKDEEVQSSHQVCLAFADISGDKYVSVT